MSAYYLFFKEGIVAVRAGPEAAYALQVAGRQIADDVARFYGEVDDASNLWEVVYNSLQSNGLASAEVLGAVAFSGGVVTALGIGAATVGAVAVAGEVMVAIGLGWAAGKFYEWAFDNAVGIGERAGAAAFDLWEPQVDLTVNTATTNALNWVAPRRDPLVLDLDGGGITTSGINPAAPIYFDHDGDGTLTASGWIAAGETIVVRDLNGNGVIDSGRELFGDNTILTHGPNAGQLAANGFAALADLDANASGVADGKFDANDVAFSSVKLWKDLNQDGISQSGELFTFAALGIQSINVSGTATNINLGGGNTQTFSGSFTRVGGQSGGSTTAELPGSFPLASAKATRLIAWR